MRAVPLDEIAVWKYEQQQYQTYMATEAGSDGIINKIRGNPDYVKFLLIEYPRIRSALDVQALTLDEEERIARHPTSVGSALHLDLIELDEWLASLSPQDRIYIKRWISRQERAPVVGTRFIASYRDHSKANDARRASVLIDRLSEKLDIPKPAEAPANEDSEQ